MNKYNAKKIKIDGMSFDSQKEYQRWCELRLLERAGVITNLQRQVSFVVIPKQATEEACKYIADFVYEENGETIVEDVKGYKKGPAYNLFVIKRKLMLEKYGIRIKET